MKNKYFGTDGIRGTVNKGNITGEKFFKFGLASGTYFKNQRKKKQIAIIAKDTRLSGYTLEPALVSGLVSGGMHVFTLGPLPTNGLAMLTKSMGANMGIMITASHNPYYDNGLKLFGPDGMKLSNAIEKRIEKLIDAKNTKQLSNPKYLGRVKRLEDGNEKSTLEYISYKLEKPKFDVIECKQRSLSYADALKANLRLVVYEIDAENNTKQILSAKEQEVFIVDLPLMTPSATFITNGVERVVVN